MKTLSLRLVLDLDFDTQGEAPEFLKGCLHQIVKDAASNGTFTGESPATVEKYNYNVTIRRPKKKSTKLFTVNVSVFNGGILEDIFSFADTAAGNKSAERKFCACIRDLNDPERTTGVQPMSRMNMQEFIDNGYYEDGVGHEVRLTHSTN
jgi:hypothetical protein